MEELVYRHDIPQQNDGQEVPSSMLVGFIVGSIITSFSAFSLSDLGHAATPFLVMASSAC